MKQMILLKQYNVNYNISMPHYKLGTLHGNSFCYLREQEVYIIAL